MGRDREEALAEYDARVRVDTMEWGRRGIVDFYPEYDPQQVRASYDEAINEWTHNSSTTSWPLEILERKIQSLDKIKDPKSVEILSCSAVF